jgi:hypothetical protein
MRFSFHKEQYAKDGWPNAMQEMFIISMKCKASIYTKISAIYYYKQ